MLPTLNLGVVAHVDAGKTSLTEQLLFQTGAIDRLGSVDDGTTQTDGLALERARGITIKAALASFRVDDLVVNLIDTPGHPDFIAEVERSLSVLDAAVLVVSATAGVQAQTRVLFRALRRLDLPVIIFVNKTDIVQRPLTEVVEQIHRRLDDASPLIFGSAVTGAGVAELIGALPGLLPAGSPSDRDKLSASVFKIERSGSSTISYVRLHAGRLRVRERLPGREGRRGSKITGIEVYDGGPPQRANIVSAGQIGRLRGPADLRIGDAVGVPPPGRRWSFERPALETVITAEPPGDAGRLFLALTELAAQDPLIGFRQHDDELRVALFGEVQKEVLTATLDTDYGLRVTFAPTSVVCLERPVGVGEAVEVLYAEDNPYLAGVGLRVEPEPVGSGERYRVAGDRRGTMPPAFFRAVEESVTEALGRGPHGWPVRDCTVTLIATGYAPRQSHAHATFDKSMSSTAGDFRQLTPKVLARALRAAGTVVCEPILRVRAEVPDDTVAAVLAAVVSAEGVPDAPTRRGDLVVLEMMLPARNLGQLTRLLPGLTRGEGVLESALDHHAPAPVPRRRATGRS